MHLQLFYPLQVVYLCPFLVGFKFHCLCWLGLTVFFSVSLEQLYCYYCLIQFVLGTLQKAIQVSNSLTEGLKYRRRYRWYGVWDIWRRLPFVAANLFISQTTRSTVLVCSTTVEPLIPFRTLPVILIDQAR